MWLSCVSSASHPPWVVSRGVGGRGGDRMSGSKPNQGNAGKGGNRRMKWEAAVDESIKEMAEKVARHEAH